MSARSQSRGGAPPELDISQDKLAYIVALAREYDVKEGDSDPDSGSNPIDDRDADILEDQPGDPIEEELADAIEGLNEDEQAELVALAWLGRGTYDIGEWDEAVRTARQEHDGRMAQYLMGLPLLGDYLEEGLAQLTASPEDGGGDADEDGQDENGRDN